MEILLGLVIFIFDVVAIVDALRSSLAAGKKVLWIILILFLPVLGMILYFLLGKNSK